MWMWLCHCLQTHLPHSSIQTEHLKIYEIPEDRSSNKHIIKRLEKNLHKGKNNVPINFQFP